MKDIIINIKEIQELIDSDITSYEIMRDTGVKNTTIDKYRKGVSLERMTLATLIKLQEFINERRHQDED